MDFIMKGKTFSTELKYGELTIAGDEANGFRPFQLMVSSIAVCSGGILRNILEKQRMDIEDLKIKADVTRSESATKRIEKIHLHFIIKGKNLVEKKVQKAMELVYRNCPMVQSVEGCIEITVTFETV